MIEAKKEIKALDEENRALSARVAELESRLRQQHRLRFIGSIVTLIHFGYLEGDSLLIAAANFLEDLIDACVMECYFREHMAERDLLFCDTVAPHLADYDPEAGEKKQRNLLSHLYTTLNAPSHPIRNRLLRLTADNCIYY